MITDLGELNNTEFETIAIPFEWNGNTVSLKREEDFEVEHSNQNVFRGLTSEIEGIKNGDTFQSPYYKNNKVLKVISAQYWGNDALWVLITAEDREDLSFG